ncbi:MAG: hypothetical protein AB1796_15265 [Bacillota bacterium]
MVSAESSTKATMEEIMEDYALKKTPFYYQNSWLSHFAMLSIPLCMYYLAVGSLSAAFAGVRLGMLASIVAYIVFIIFTMFFGYLSWKCRYSFDMIARMFGWGHKGSFLPSLLATWLFITFWAMETHWMAVCIQHMYDINIWWYYLILLPLFILVPLFGHRALAFWNYVALPVGVIATIYLLIQFYVVEPHSMAQAFEALANPVIPGGFGAALDWSLFAVGLWAITAGNFGRFIVSKASATYGIAIFQGLLSHIVVPITGILLVFPLMVKLTPAFGAEAGQLAFLPSIPYVYVLGWFGVLIVLTWQLNVQYINAYLPSVNLANFFSVMFNWEPGRKIWVVVINLLGLLFLGVGLLESIESVAGYAAVTLCSAATICMADYFYRYQQKLPLDFPLTSVKNYNPLSFVTFIISVLVGIIFWKTNVVPSPSIITLPLTFILYYVLSLATKGKYQELKISSEESLNV